MRRARAAAAPRSRAAGRAAPRAPCRPPPPRAPHAAARPPCRRAPLPRAPISSLVPAASRPWYGTPTTTSSCPACRHSSSAHNASTSWKNVHPCARAAAASCAVTAAGSATGTLPPRKVCRAGRAKSSGSSSGGNAPSSSAARQYARCGPRCAGSKPRCQAAKSTYCTRSAGSAAAASPPPPPPPAFAYSAPSSRSISGIDVPSKATWCTVNSSRWRASPVTRTSRQRSTAAPAPNSSKPSNASAAAATLAAATLDASASRSNAPPPRVSPSPPPAARTRCTKPPSASSSYVVRSTACRATSALSAVCSTPATSGPRSQSASVSLYANSAPPPPACTVSICDWFHETGYASPTRTPPASDSNGGSDDSKPSPPTVAVRCASIALNVGYSKAIVCGFFPAVGYRSLSKVANFIKASDSSPASSNGISAVSGRPVISATASTSATSEPESVPSGANPGPEAPMGA
eukprot:scaffold4143_cov72-Phaeocystis_antarctica.AAC.3